MKKIFILLNLCVFILFILSPNFVFASNTQMSLKEACSIIAINWAKDFSNEEVSIKESIPIINSHNVITGYSVSYSVDNIPYGYSNINFTYDEPVYEFVIEKNAISLYDNLVSKATKALKVSNEDITNKIFTTNALSYFVENKNLFGGDYFVDASGSNVYTDNEFDELCDKVDNYSDTVYKNGSIIFFDKINTSRYKNISSTKVLKKFSTRKYAFSESRIESATKKYACAVVALTNIAYNEGVAMSSLKKTFNTLWTYTNTRETTKSGGITYGTTGDTFLASGMKRYVNQVGKKFSCFTKKNPTSSFYKTAIDRNHSATLSYRMYVKDGNSSKKIGHTISVVGYCTANRKDNGNKKNFLYILNGWDGYAKYLNYTDVDFSDGYGIEYIIE